MCRPIRDGLLSPEDIASLKGFGDYLRGTFAQNLAASAKTDASTFAETISSSARRNLLDGTPDTYWATDDRVTSADVTFDLGRAAKFQVIRLKEAIQFGQRIDALRSIAGSPIRGCRSPSPPASGRGA